MPMQTTAIATITRVGQARVRTELRGDGVRMMPTEISLPSGAQAIEPKPRPAGPALL